jgi:hypothetical protein
MNSPSSNCAASAHSMAIAQISRGGTEASSKFWLSVCPARVRLRCSGVLEMRRAFEIRFYPTVFCHFITIVGRPLAASVSGECGPSVVRPIPAPTSQCAACIFPPLPSSTTHTTSTSLARRFRVGQVHIAGVISCCPLSRTKGGQLRYGQIRGPIIGREIRRCSAECPRRHHGTTFLERYSSSCAWSK